MSKSALGYLRRQYLCVLRRCAWLNAMASGAALMAVAPMAAQAQTIVPDGRTQTQLNVNGSVTDITTQTVRGPNAFNSFSRFDVNQGATVNLHLPGGTANLLNLVTDHRSYINGLVNAYRDGAIGGNVFFFNPLGIVVGQGGVINTGSLTLSSPTPDFMNRLMGASGAISDAATRQALDGQVPLSASGLISVQGQVNSMDAVNLAGAQVHIEAGAQVLAGGSAQVNFGHLVNVQGAQQGAGVSIDGGSIRIVAAQDIAVAGQVSADGFGAQAQGGSVWVMAERDASLQAGAVISANAGGTGDGGAVEFSAKDTVHLAGGSLQARAPYGKAGSVLIDPENVSVDADLLRASGGNADGLGTTWDAGSLTIQADNQLSVADGVVISTRQVAANTRAAHLNDASTGDSGNLTLKAAHIDLGTDTQLLADTETGGAFQAGDVTVKATDINAIGAVRSASADVQGEHVTIRGRNITVSATADTSLLAQLLETAPTTTPADAQTYLNNELDNLSDGPGGEYLAITTDATARTELRGVQITASGDVDISAKAGARAGFEKNAQADVVIGDQLAADGVTVLASSRIEGHNIHVDSAADTSLTYNVAGSALTLLDQSWLPDPDSGLVQLLDDQLFDFSSVPLVSLSTSRANTSVSGATVLQAADALTVASSATSAAKPSFASPLLFSAAWGESDAQATTTLGGTTQLIATGKASLTADTDVEMEVTASVDSTNKPIDAVFARADNRTTTTVDVGDDTRTDAGSVDARATTQVDLSLSADAKNTGGSGLGLALGINESSNTTTARLGGDVIARTGDVNVDATIDVGGNGTSANAATLGKPGFFDAKFNNPLAQMKQNVSNGLLNATGKLKPGTSSRISSFLFPIIKEGKFNLSGAVAYSDSVNTATAYVAPQAIVKVQGDLSVTSSITDRPNASVGAKSSSVGTALGGSAVIANFANNANAYLGKGSLVDAKGALLVDANTHVPYPWQINWESPEDILDFLQGGVLDMVLTSYALNSSSAKNGLGISAAVSVFGIDNSANAWIDEGAQVNTVYDKDAQALPDQSVKVHARNDINTVNAVGILSKKFFGSSGKSAVGGSANFVDVEETASATIRGNAQVKSAGTVDVRAENLNQLVTVTEAGGKAEEVGIEGALSVNTLTGHATAAIDDDAHVDSDGDVDLVATSDLQNITVAGGVVATKGPAGIGFAVSLNSIDTSADAYIGNYDPLGLDTAPATGEVKSDGDVNLTATSLTEIGAYSVSGAIATESKAQTDVPSDAQTTSSKGSSGQGKFGIAVSGDASVNDIVSNTRAYIADGATVSQAQDAQLKAGNTLAINALAGAVTISTQSNGNGLAGSYAQNSLTGTTAAYLDNASLTLGGDLGLDATVDGKIRTLAASVQATKGKVGVAGSVTVNDIGHQTQAYVTGSQVNSVQAAQILASDSSAIHSIAGAAAFAGGKGGIGLAFAWNQIHNKTQAYVDVSDVFATGAIDLSAESKGDIQTIAASLGASQGGLAGAGALALSSIGNTTEATATLSTLNSSGGQVALQAADRSDIFSVSGGAAVSGGQAAVGVAASVNDIDNTTRATATGGTLSGTGVSLAASASAGTAGEPNIQAIAVGAGGGSRNAVTGSLGINTIGNRTTASSSGAALIATAGDVSLHAADTSEILSITGAAAIGGSNAVGASGSYNHIGGSVKADLSGGSASGANVRVGAERAGTLDVWAISGSGAGTTGIAGSIALNDAGGGTTARVGEGALVNATGNALITAEADDLIKSRAGAVGLGGSVGGAGGIAFNDIHADTQAEVAGAGTQVNALGQGPVAQVDNGELAGAGDLKTRQQKDALKGVAVVASSTAEVENYALSAAGGGSAAVAATVSIAMMGGSTKAEVTGGARLNAALGGAGQEARVAAYHHDTIVSGTGGGAVGGDAGVGGAADTAVVSHLTRARVEDAQAQAVKAVQVDAGATTDITQAVIAVGGGVYAGLAGTVGVVLVDGTTEALAKDAELSSQGQVAVEATSDADVDLTAGALAVSGVAGVGITAAVTVVEQQTRADVSGSSALNANDATRIHAGSTFEQKNDAYTAAAAGGVGVAGTVNVVVVKGSTDAALGAGSSINADAAFGGASQDVAITASDDSRVTNRVGSLGVGGTAGVGAVADVTLIHNGATASVAGGASITADRDITIAANTVRDVNSTATALAGGYTAGIAGAVSVISVGARPQGDAQDNSTGSVGKAGDMASASATGDQMGSEGSASASRADAARSSVQLSQDLDTTPVATSAAASVGAGATLDAGRHVDVRADNRTDTDAVAVGAAASAGIAIGGGVAIATVADRTLATLAGNTTAGGHVNVLALDHQTDASTLRTYAGGGGLAGLAASYAWHDKSSQAQARLGGVVVASGAVTVEATLDHDLEALGGALAGGAVGVGAAIAKIDQDSEASAELLDNTRVSSSALTVGSDAKTAGNADVAAAAGGLLAGAAGALAEASDGAKALASIGANAFIRTGTGALTLHADVNPQAQAKALGVAVSGGVSIGASVANVEVKTVARATTGANADITAGSMDVRARTLRNGDTARSTAVAGAGGLLLGASATKADASVDATTEAALGDNNEITTGGDLSVQALASTRATADVTGINAGLLAAGSNTAKARTNTGTHVRVGDGAELVATSVRLRADGSDTLRAGTVSGAGGLGVLIASKAETDADADTSVALGTQAGNGGTVAADVVDIDAVQHIDFDATANSTSAAAVGASGARAINHVDAQTQAAIGQNMTVSAQDLFSARAGNDIDKSTASASGYQVDSGSGGLLNGAAARSDTQIRNDAQVSVGRGALLSVNNDALTTVLDNNGRLVNVPVNGLLELAAWNEVAAYDRVRLDSGGAIAIARAESFIDNENKSGISVSDDAALLSDGQLELSARTSATAQTRAHSKTYGLAGAAEGRSGSSIRADQSVQIGANAFLEAGESVHLMAGTDRAQANNLQADAETRLWNRTAIPIETDPDANGSLTQHNDITIASGAQVRAVRDVHLTATEGAHKARGYGEGTDLYREVLSAIGEFFGADTSSLKITGGSSSDNALRVAPAGGPSSRVQVEGSVQAGIRSHQWITVAADGSITSSDALDGLATTSDGENVAQLLQQEIDELDAVAQEKTRQYEDFKGGAAVAAALGAQAEATAARSAALQDQAEANLVQTNVQGFVDTAEDAATSAAAAAAAATNAANLAAAQVSGATGTASTAAVKVANAASATATAASATSAAAASTAASQAESARDDLIGATNATADAAAKAYLQTMADAASDAAAKARAVANAVAAQAAVNADANATAAAKTAAAQATGTAIAAANAAAKSAAVVAANDAAASASQAVSSANTAVASANAGLNSANADLAAARDAGGTSDAALGIGADVQFLSTQLSQLQGATDVDFVDIGSAGDIITARSGNVRVSGKALTGNGALVAPGDAKIEIRNGSTRFMRVNAELLIPDEGGGQVTFNGMRVSNKADINQRNAVGQTANLSITDALNTSKPLILVENSASGNSGNSGGAAQLWIFGNITNLGGEAKATSHGTLRVAGNVSAETVTLATGGDFIKTWSPGYTHQGGDPVARLGNLPNQREAAKADYARNGLPDCNDVACGSTIAGNNVYISAEKLNINGLIQAGLPERGIAINDALLDSANAIDATRSNRAVMQDARAAWNANPGGATRYFDLTNPTADGIADSGDIKLRYDAEFDRLELADVRMGGGHMELFGDIFSTGNGELRVMDGYGRINISNTTTYDLAVGRLDTGPGVEGMIRITDTARDLNGNYRGADNAPLVTEITRVNGVATTRTNTGAGGAMQVVTTSTANDGRNTTFNPMVNRRFNWINENVTNWQRIETYETKTTWGADFLGRDPGRQPSDVSAPKVTYTGRVSGDWLSIEGSQGADYLLDYTNDLTPERKTNLPTTSRAVDCFLGVCHSRIYSSKEKYTWTQTETFQHSLNASQGVAVKFTGFDSSDVKIDAGGQLLFSGLVRSVAGGISLDADQGMSALNPDARLLGQQIGLDASAGAIGTVAAPVRVELVGGGALTASGRDGVAVGSTRGDLLVNSVSAALGDVHLSADGDIRTLAAGTAVTGQNVSLASINGGIHGLTDDQALQVETLGSAGHLSASAVGDIRLQEATGDLRVRQVASTTGDVHLAAPGRLLDANTVEQVDEQGRQELLGLWAEMGLTGVQSQDALDRSLASQTGQLKQQYESYFRMRRLHLNDDGSYSADPYNAGFTFELTTNQAESLKTANGWSDAELATYKDTQTAAYHTAHARFGDAGYVAGFTPALTPAEIAALSEGSQWTEAQLTNALAAGLFRPTTDTDIRIEEANVVGRHVSLTAQTGIGMQQGAPTVITLDADGLLSDEHKLALLTAERSDITVDGNGQISVRQYEDLDVTVAGVLNASTASGSALLGSEADLTLGQVSATDEVRIKTGASLLGEAGRTHVVAERAVLEAGQGSLGSAGTPISVDLGASGTLTARAGTDLFVREVNGDMVVGSVFARGDVHLDAQGSIVESVEDSLLDVRGTNVALNAGDTVGRPGGQNALDVQVGKDGLLSASAPHGIYLSSSGTSGKLGDITTQGTFELTVVDGGVTLVGTVQADAGVALAASDDIRYEGGQVRSDASVALTGGTDGSGSVLGDGNGVADVVAGGPVTVVAANDIGGNQPLQVEVAREITLRATHIDAEVSPLTAGHALSVTATGPIGDVAHNVNLNFTRAGPVVFPTLVLHNGTIRSDGADLSVVNGYLGDAVTFVTPFFGARIDHIVRSTTPGLDVRAFTLDNDFSLTMTAGGVQLNDLIVNQNLLRNITSTPPGVADVLSAQSLQTLQRQLPREGELPEPVALPEDAPPLVEVEQLSMADLPAQANPKAP